MNRVLVVDDEDKIREDLQKIFSSKNYDCLNVSDLGEFFDAIEAAECGEIEQFDLIILDHQIGAIYGWDLLNSVRSAFGENCCSYKFVVCTGNLDGELNRRYQRLGSLNHIVKPYSSNLHQFWSIIEGALFDPRRELHKGHYYWNTLSKSQQTELRYREIADAKLLSDYAKLFRIITEWAVYYAEKGELDEVFNIINTLLTDTSINLENKAKNKFQNLFDILESLVPYSVDNPKIRDLIANHYLDIGFKAIDYAYLKNKPISGVLRTIRLFFHQYYPAYESDLLQYLESKLSDQKVINTEYESILETATAYHEKELPLLELDEDVYIGIAGGKDSVRKNIISAFSNAPKVKFVEVPPSSEARVNTSYIKDRLQKCDLIVMITGYMGHDLSRNIVSLHRSGALEAEIITPSCRGCSGVVREIQHVLVDMNF